MKLEIAHGRIVDPATGVDGEGTLYVADGVIAGVNAKPDGWQATRVLDARGLVVAPGLVDVSARLREPGLEYKATQTMVSARHRSTVAGVV